MLEMSLLTCLNGSKKQNVHWRKSNASKGLFCFHLLICYFCLHVLWDSPAQSRFDSLLHSSLRELHSYFLTHDLQQPATHQEVCGSLPALKLWPFRFGPRFDRFDCKIRIMSNTCKCLEGMLCALVRRQRLLGIWTERHENASHQAISSKGIQDGELAPKAALAGVSCGRVASQRIHL